MGGEINLKIPEEDRKLAKDPDGQVRAAAAGNQNISQVLKKWVEDPDPAIRELAAKDPNISQEDLKKLAEDPHLVVRAGAAGNPNISQEDLKKLAEDPDWTVVSSAAENAAKNPNTPPEIVAELNKKKDKKIKEWERQCELERLERESMRSWNHY